MLTKEFLDRKFDFFEDLNTTEYGYDLNGNLITKQEKGLSGKVWNYSYTSENQMTKAEYYEGATKLKSVSFSYDVQGKRIKKSVQDLQNSNEYERKFVYDGSEIIAELDEDNNVLARYTHSGLRTDDVLSASITSEGVTAGLAVAQGSVLYLKDGLGSIQSVTNASGNVLQRYVYSSFGKLLKIVDEMGSEITPVIKTAYTYTNRELDEETGLYYYRARFYDPARGQFLTEDPDAGRLRRPGTFNSKYSYVLGNPISNLDPLGLSVFSNINTSIKLLADSAWQGTVNIWNKNQAEIIAGAIIIGAIAIGGPVATTGLIVGGVAAGFSALNGGNSRSIALSFIGGFAAGSLASAFGGLGASFGSGFGTTVAGGAIGGAAGGVLGAHANAQITRGEWATGTEMAIGGFAGALGGVVTAASRGANSFSSFVSGASSDTAGAVAGSASSPSPSASHGNIVFIPN